MHIPTVNFALKILNTYPKTITSTKQLEDMPSAMPLAAMHGCVAADFF